MTERVALKLALEALNHYEKAGLATVKTIDAITAIKEVLAQPEQEPVAWMKEGWGPDCGPYIEFYRDDEMGWRDRKEWTPLYINPPQRTWVGLTDEEIFETHKQVDSMQYLTFGKAIEAKLKEKNT